MTSENEPQSDEQAADQPQQTGASEPSMADIVEAMKSQQEATSKGFAELTSGLSQFLEKMAAVAAPAAGQPAASGAKTPEAAAPEPPQAKLTAQAPQESPTPPVAQAPQPQPVAQPPVDPAAYADQAVPATGFPQGAAQAAAPTGFPAPGQPQAAPAASFPAAQDPQAPMQPAPVAQTPVPQAEAPQPSAQQASPGFPDVGKPIRAARDFIRGKRATQVQPVGPPQPQPQQPQQPVQDDRWKNIFFGPDLANNEALTALRDKVVQGLLGGDRNTTGLAGTLLLFQSATPDRMPPILKDVGEAYYRWNPRTALGNDPLRNALITWLHRKCESVGVSNTIEIVQPGDRFESSRHNAKQRGVEVTQVAGWVVLRDNGKVYTKATVAVK